MLVGVYLSGEAGLSGIFFLFRVDGLGLTVLGLVSVVFRLFLPVWFVRILSQHVFFVMFLLLSPHGLGHTITFVNVPIFRMQPSLLTLSSDALTLCFISFSLKWFIFRAEQPDIPPLATQVAIQFPAFYNNLKGTFPPVYEFLGVSFLRLGVWPTLVFQVHIPTNWLAVFFLCGNPNSCYEPHLFHLGRVSTTHIGRQKS